MEWNKVRNGMVSVDGFPPGLKPAPASSYGKENLQRILNDEINITFTGRKY